MQGLTQDDAKILHRLIQKYPISFDELDACYKSCFQKDGAEGAYGSSRPLSPPSVIDLPNPDAPEFTDKSQLTEADAAALQSDFTKLGRRLIDPGGEAPEPRTKFTRKELERRVETTKRMIENPARKDKGILARVVGTIAEVVVKLPFMTTVVQALIHALFCGMMCAQYSYKDDRGLAMSAIAFVMGFVGAVVTKYFHIVPFFTKYVRNILKYFESWPIMGVLVTLLRTFLNYVDFLASSGCFSQLLMALGKLAKGKEFFDKYTTVGGVSATELMTTGLTGTMFTMGMALLHKALIKALSPYFSKVAVFFGGNQMALMIEAFADARVAYSNKNGKVAAAAMAKAQAFGWTIVTACLSAFCPDEYGTSCKVVSAILSYQGAYHAIRAIKDFYDQKRCVRVVGAEPGTCTLQRPPDETHKESWEEEGLTDFFVAWKMKSPAGLAACLQALSCVPIDWAFKHPRFQTFDASKIPQKVGELVGRPLDKLQRAVGAAAPLAKLGKAADAVTGAAAHLIQGGATQLDDALSSPAESEELRDADTSGDGYVSKKEYEAYKQSQGADKVPEFKDMDTDGDGRVKVSTSKRRFSDMVSGLEGTSLTDRGAAADEAMVERAQFKSERSEIRNLRENKDLLNRLNKEGFDIKEADLREAAREDNVLDGEELKKLLQEKAPERYKEVEKERPKAFDAMLVEGKGLKNERRVWNQGEGDTDARINRFAKRVADGAQTVTKDQLREKAPESLDEKDLQALEDYLQAHSPSDDTINVRDYNKLGENAAFLSKKAVSAYDKVSSVPSKAVSYAVETVAAALQVDKAAALHDRLTGQREDGLGLIARQTGSNVGNISDRTTRLKVADTDEDGYVSKDELVKLMEKNDSSKTFDRKAAEETADKLLEHVDNPSKGLRVRGTFGDKAQGLKDLLKGPLETLKKSGVSGVLAKAAETARSSSPTFAPLDADEVVKNSTFQVVSDHKSGSKSMSLEEFIGRPVTKADEWAIREIADENAKTGFKPLTASVVGRALAISDETHGLGAQYEAERVEPTEGADINAYTFNDGRLKEGLKEARSKREEMQKEGLIKNTEQGVLKSSDEIVQTIKDGVLKSSEDFAWTAKTAMSDAFQSIRRKLGESKEEATEFIDSVTSDAGARLRAERSKEEGSAPKAAEAKEEKTPAPKEEETPAPKEEETPAPKEEEKPAPPPLEEEKKLDKAALRAILEKLDVDSAKGVKTSMDSFFSGRSNQEQARNLLRQVVRDADLDGDGQVSRAELDRLVGQDASKEIMRHLDVNEDGKVSVDHSAANDVSTESAKNVVKDIKSGTFSERERQKEAEELTRKAEEGAKKETKKATIQSEIEQRRAKLAQLKINLAMEEVNPKNKGKDWWYSLTSYDDPREAEIYKQLKNDFVDSGSLVNVSSSKASNREDGSFIGDSIRGASLKHVLQKAEGDDGRLTWQELRTDPGVREWVRQKAHTDTWDRYDKLRSIDTKIDAERDGILQLEKKAAVLDGASDAELKALSMRDTASRSQDKMAPKFSPRVLDRSYFEPPSRVLRR